MLCVLLLRHMPWEYDAFAARLPPLEAMRRLWRLEGVEGVPWRAATAKADRLSEPLRDLLDKMLAADEAKRPSLEEVRAHPWVARRLPAALEGALAALKERQAAAEVSAGGGGGGGDGAGGGGAGGGIRGSTGRFWAMGAALEQQEGEPLNNAAATK